MADENEVREVMERMYRAAEDERLACGALYEEGADLISRLLSALSEATKRAEAAEQDAARLDWIIDTCPYLPLGNGLSLHENSRAAIDAARAQGER